jgi:3-oxoadipate enol-lactonase
MIIKANGIDINYEVQGLRDGPWLVLSHSLACDLRMWDEQVDVFAKRFRVLRYDTRGHGQSSAPAGDYTLDQLAADAQALFHALGITHCHWVGLSMGGMIGQTFALKYPGVFSTLTLADTTSRRHEGAREMWDARIKLANEKGMGALVEPTLQRWFTEPFRKANPAVMARIGAMIRGIPAAGYAGCARAISAMNLTARLKEITCPALVMAGAEDAGTPVEMTHEIHANLPGSEMVIIPAASHLSNVEQPAAFNAALSAFLGKH